MPVPSFKALPARALFVGSAMVIAIFAALPPVATAETVTRTVAERTVSVRTPRMPSGLSLRAGIVVDAETGRALWALNSRERRLIASTTKIMTALVAISRANADRRLKVVRYPRAPAESVLGLKAGERMTVEDLLRALLLHSANDAAHTLAVRLGGSRDAFVEAMNRRARVLGLDDTRYGNPVGLDTPRTESTARDLAKLAIAAMREPRFKAIVGRRGATLRSGAKKRRIANRNKLVRHYEFVDGVKTGFTSRAGFLLVGSATRSDARVISVVMGEPSERARDKDSIKLLRFGRAFFRPVRPVVADHTVARLPVALRDTEARVYAKRTVSFALRDREGYKLAITAEQELEGPLAAGSRVGVLNVSRNGREYAELPIYLRDAIPAPPVTAVLMRLLGRMLPPLLGLAILFMMGLLLMRRRTRRRTRATGKAAARPFTP